MNVWEPEKVLNCLWSMQANRTGPLRVLILSGSQRRQKNCPQSDSKSRAFMLRMAERLPKDWVVDYEDLGNVKHTDSIQPCNACVSTSMALCVWPCNCYSKSDTQKPDLLWNLDLYARLDLADAWAIIGPQNWFSYTTNFKLLFDRLVCASGGNPKEELIDNKNKEKAIALEHSPQWKDLNKNHLEGRTAGFFSHGDYGGDELDEDGRPKILEHKEYYNPDEIGMKFQRDAYAPLVWQCRYSGIEVPDELWTAETIGEGKPYSENQVKDIPDEKWKKFDEWTDKFALFVRNKGKVPQNKFPVFNYDRAAHLG